MYALCDPPAPCLTATEGRRFPRRPVAGGQLEVTVFVEDVPYPARAREVSVAGVGLVLGGPLRPDAEIALHLANQRTGFTCFRLARVVHSETRFEGGWLVGCHFAAALRPWQLDELVGPDAD